MGEITEDMFYRAMQQIEQENIRLRAALEVQREIWQCAEPILNEIDNAAFQVRFMEMWRPMEKIDHALNPSRTKRATDYRSGEE